MSKRDGMSCCNYLPVLAPVAVALADNTEQLSAAIDVRGAREVTFVIVTGTLEDANATFTVEVRECDTSDGVFTAVADADLVGTEALASFTYANDSVCRKIGYKGNKGFVKLSITPANNTGNAPLAAIVELSELALEPAPNPPAVVSYMA